MMRFKRHGLEIDKGIFPDLSIDEPREYPCEQTVKERGFWSLLVPIDGFID
jgi:hypothetical protein